MMRNITITVLVLIAFAIVTKPSDQSCIDHIKDTISGQLSWSTRNTAEILDADLADQYGMRIEDNILFKSIYRKGSNETLAVGLFGVVIGTN